MARTDRTWRHVFAAGGLVTLFGGMVVLVTVAAHSSEASVFWHKRSHPAPEDHGGGDPGCVGEHDLNGGLGGTWYWLHSPEEEKRVIASLYNRYCIRCHGVDGRGIWDIPDVPDFTNARWQATRSDAQLARTVLEGRGAVMPPFRGTLNLEEAWAMARYLRTFIPGTETPRPDVGKPSKTGDQSPAPAPKKGEGSRE